MPPVPKPIINPIAKRLGELANTLPVGLIYYDAQLTCVFANSLAYDFFGFEPATTLGRHLSELIEMKRFVQVKPHFERALRGQTARYQRDVPHPDGSTRWIEFTVLPDYAPEETTLPLRMAQGLFVFISDMTEARAQDHERAVLASRLDLAARMISMTLWDWDTVKGLVEVDQSFTAMVGRVLDQTTLTMAQFVELVHPDDRPPAAASLQRCLRGEGDFDGEYRVRSAQGEWLWLHTRGRVLAQTTLANGASRALRVAGVSFNITARKEAEAALRASESQLRLIADHLPGTILHIGRDWVCRFQNEAHRRLFAHVSTVSGLGKHLREVIGAADFAVMEPQYARAFAGETAQIERKVKRPNDPDGDRYITIRLVPSVDEQGDIDGAYSLAVDTTERHLAEAKTADAEARFRALTQLSADWYWEQDAHYRFTLRSESSAEFDQRLNLRDLIGRTRWELPVSIVAPESWAIHRAQLDRREVFRDLILRSTNAHGEVTYVSSSGEPIFDAQGIFTGYRGIGRDVTERFAREERIAYLAYHDVLTDLPNRTLVQDRITQSLVHAQRTRESLAVLFVDLDRFKSINDSLGHEVGDQVLTEIAQRFSACLGPEATLGRFSGDEFVILLPHLQFSADAAATASQLIGALAPEMNFGGQAFTLTCSIGIALYPDDGADMVDLVRNADAAMFHAKESGRNTFRYFTTSLNAHASRRLSLESDLKRGLERGEFSLEYQPQVVIASGKVAGIEALARWTRAERGAVPPSEFIPLCENIGVMGTLGKWVLETALAQMRLWIDARVAPQRIAVNVSPQQLNDPRFGVMVTQALIHAGVAANRLELEITESAALEHKDDILATIDYLRRTGVQFCLDDFGTGYSSLAYLKRFPVDVIKIDRSFVREVHMNNGDAAVVKAILALARGLNMHVVAEGVETQEQAAILRALDCPVAQGYFHSYPLKDVACTQFLRDRGVL